jgi:hypothetical protein
MVDYGQVKVPVERALLHGLLQPGVQSLFCKFNLGRVFPDVCGLVVTVT